MESNMTKQFKINPDLTCPELAGYKLPSFSRSQEDDVEIPEGFANSYQSYEFGEGYKSGYTKAREKFEFSEEQLKQAFFTGFEMALDTFSSKSKSVVFHNYLKSLRTPRNPIAIEVEMSYYYKDSVQFDDTDTIWIQCYKSRFDELKKSTMIETKEVPILNPDGTVKGRYIYE
jgi:hypothetical protein